MSYEANYKRPYPDGYVNIPDESTPEMAEFINARDDAIIKIEQYLANLDIGGDYALLTEAGYSLELMIDSNYVMTISLKNKLGTVLSSKNIDFPIESMVVNATYENGKITLTLQNGNTLDIDIFDMVKGLVPTNRTIAGIDLEDDITKEELKNALGIYDSTVVGGEIKPWLYDTSGKEVIVGVYNGKPLYRRFFYANLTTTNNNVDAKLSDYVDNFSDIELLIDYILYTPAQNRLPINYISSSLQGSSAMGFVSVKDDIIRINHGNMVSFNNAEFRIMIEYTKKTDAEGSGNKLNPYGIYDAIVEGFLSKEDVVDNLLSTSTDLPLSANQGRILKEDVNNLIKNGGSVPLLNGAVGTLAYIKLPYEMYLIFGYVKVTGNKWFANFPAVPSTLYPNQDAKIIGIDSSGTPCSININSYAGMTMPEDEGEYWINGILYAP